MLSILQRVLEETAPVLVSARVEAKERRTKSVAVDPLLNTSVSDLFSRRSAAADQQLNRSETDVFSS
ncbi:hypothetical protein SOVF_171370 [Spinacia oleracea]|nr:hypothetical protein SOVF_171370 [Spinacia oleracea]